MSVFLSWQSDLPANAHRNAIRTALSRCLKKYPNLKLDEATREMAGSDDIAQTILDKIQAAEIFVADISTIRRKYGTGRPVPNPNVVFEVGYAVAHLGWSRVILLFNDESGSFPRDVPFDFLTKRIARYSIAAKPTKAEKESLETLLGDALAQIIRSSPARPAELRGLDERAIRRERDIENLRWILSEIHFPTLQDAIDTGPNILNHDVITLFEGFRGVFQNQLFHLNDAEMFSLLKELYEAWDDVLSFGEHYDNLGAKHYKFIYKYGVHGNVDAYEDAKKAYRRLAIAIPAVLDEVRKKYVEIDISETNRAAHDELVALNRQFFH